MLQAPLGTVLRHIRHFVDPAGVRELSDAQLLERFVHWREESAFAALLGRHGRLVWSVCRQVLHHEQDAEDAFQATFLVLARHAGSIRRGQAVSSWLYHVAYRIALRAGTDRTRRRTHERQAGAMTHGEAGSNLAWRELQDVLDAELQRLPEKYRAPFVLCCLEGKSKPEAAQLLGWKEGTVSGRLAQARKLLQQRLTQRGMMFSAALCATTLAREAEAAPAALVGHTVRGAVLCATDQTAAAGFRAEVAALAEGVTKAMFISKARLATALLLAVGIFAAGLGLLSRQALAARSAKDPPAEKSTAPQASPVALAPGGASPVASAPGAANEGKEDAIVLKGRVLGPNGKPVPGARLRFVNVEAESDKDGTYRVALPRPDEFKGAFTKTTRYWYVIAATAPGYGLDFRQIGTAGADGTLDLHLVKDVRIEGRILDLEGRPVAGATVRVGRLSAVPNENLDVFLKAWKFGPTEALSGGSSVPFMLPQRGAKVKKEIARPQWRTWWGYWEWNPIKPVTTGKDGKFRLTGIGRERYVELIVSGPTIQHVQVKVVTRKGIDVKDLSKPDPDYLKQEGPFIRPIVLPFPPLYGSTFEHLVGPTKPVTGVVRDKATGKPMAGVRVLGRIGSNDPSQISDIETVTDAKGRYRLAGLPKEERYFLAAVTAEQTTYLPQGKELNDTEGLKPLSADFDLERGVKVRGRLIDKATGKSVAGMVEYALLPKNIHFADAGHPGSLVGRFAHQRQSVAEGGEFQFTVYPGPGVLYATADDRRYLPIVVAPEDKTKGIFTSPGFNGGVPVHGHAYRVIDPAEVEKPLKLDLECLTGRTLAGTVVGPDGKPLRGAAGILARVPQASFGFGTHPALRIDKDSARFTVDNVDSRQPPLLIFRHPEKKLALRLEVRGDEKDPLTARLQPGGKLTGRILDATGQPLANARVDLLLGQKAGRFLQPNTFVSGAKSDKEGRFTIEGIIPETKLMLLVGITDKDGPGRTIHGINDLTWKAGEAKDLGDVKTRFKPKPAGNE
jgi:RNA polymerase sigma factor (sigma-70 family)